MHRPLLFSSSNHEMVLSADSTDFQVCIGRPSGRTAPGRAVVLLTRAGDREADELSLRLAARDVPVVRFDSDRVGRAPLHWDVSSNTCVFDGSVFIPTVCWVRSFYRSSIAATGDDTADTYVTDNWSAVAAAIAEDPGSDTINGDADMSRPGVLAQLAAAARAGLRVPTSVVTTDLAHAARSIPGDGDLVVKTLGDHFVEVVPGRLVAVLPRRVTRRELADRAAEPAPVLVQEFVASTRELRIYGVGDQLVGFEVVKASPEAPWTDPDSVTVRQVAVPVHLRRPLHRLMSRLRLDVGAFDVLETADGPVFLEVNPTGDWLSFESRAGITTVTDAVVDLLADRFANHASPPEGATHEGQGRRVRHPVLDRRETRLGRRTGSPPAGLDPRQRTSATHLRLLA